MGMYFEKEKRSSFEGQKSKFKGPNECLVGHPQCRNHAETLQISVLIPKVHTGSARPYALLVRGVHRHPSTVVHLPNFYII